MTTATPSAAPITGAATQDDAVNWLIRSVIPYLLDVPEFEEDAAWFRALPPYAGSTGSGVVGLATVADYLEHGRTFPNQRSNAGP